MPLRSSGSHMYVETPTLQGLTLPLLFKSSARPFDYSEAPSLTLSFVLNRQSYVYELSLPIVPSVFIEPFTLSAPVRPHLTQDFMCSRRHE